MIDLRFRILGPVQAFDGDRVVPVPAGRVGALLVALLVHANRVVTFDELVELLWDEQPPANPRAAVQTYVRRLRQALGPDLIRTRPQGYLIELDPSQFDLATFRGLTERAARATDAVERERVLAEALALWRGRPLAELASEPLAQQLIEERLHAHEQLIDARLELGRHAEVVAELTGLTREHPLRERFWAQLMIALHRCGRQADALAAYRRVSGLLAEELGIDPGEELQRTHRSVLATDPAAAAPKQRPAERPWVAQCQLPLEVGDFVGREDPIRELAGLLTAAGTVPVVTVSGAPGCGKTALAVRVAHRLRPAFPDGQWYVRLDGAGGNPRDTAEVLAEMLRTSGVDDGAIPDGLDARAAAFRARLADRRVLLLLDDAGSAEQVRPLLPGATGSAVLITSRRDLPGLTVSEGGRGLHLDGLDPDDAASLLTRIIGGPLDSLAVAELSELCGHLPLALRIAAANIAARPGKPVARAVSELRTGNRLAQLTIPGDPHTAVRTAFDQSYAALDPRPRRLFLLLGVIPGPDFDAAAAAALLDADRDTAGHLLDLLATANLVQRHAVDRYTFHDLLRLYAAELARTDPEREAAWRRLCDWYLNSANAAIRFEYLALARLPDLPPPDPDRFGSAEQARRWLDTELANLSAAALRAADAGPPEFAWLLINTLGRYLYETNHLHEWRAPTLAALRAARARGDRLAEGAMCHNLGATYGTAGDIRTALAHEHTAVQCYREAGLHVAEAVVLGNLAASYEEIGKARQAADMLDRALAAYRAAGMFDRAEMALANLGRVHVHLGELDGAIRRTTECLAISRTRPLLFATRWALITRARAYRLTGDLARASADLADAAGLPVEQLESLCLGELALLAAATGDLDQALQRATAGLRASRENRQGSREADVRNVLGEVHRLRGDHALAVAHHEAALRMAGDSGYEGLAAEAHVGLARALLASGEPAAAHRHAERAAAIARPLELRIVECRALLTLAETSRELDRPDDAAQFAELARHLQDTTGFVPMWASHVPS